MTSPEDLAATLEKLQRKAASHKAGPMLKPISKRKHKRRIVKAARRANR